MEAVRAAMDAQLDAGCLQLLPGGDAAAPDGIAVSASEAAERFNASADDLAKRLRALRASQSGQSDAQHLRQVRLFLKRAPACAALVRASSTPEERADTRTRGRGRGRGAARRAPPRSP